MLNSRYLKFLIFIFLIEFPVLGQNVSKTGTTAAEFLGIGVGAHARGLGTAFVSVANDASALYWNPGGIANLDGREVLISHTNWIADTKFDWAGFVLPLGDFGTLGFSYTSLGMDDMKVRTVEKPDGTGEYFSAGDIAIGVTYARKLTERFSIGFTLKYIQQSIWHMKASAFAIDAGTLFRTDLFGGMTIGAAISNFGTTMQMVGRDARYFIRVDQNKLGSNERIPTEIEMDSWELPLFFRFGLSSDAIKFNDFRMLLSVDALHPSNDYQSLSLGAELSYLDFISIRGGYESLFLKDGEGGLSFGVGVNSKLIFSDAVSVFNYGYRDFGRLSAIHSFSLSIIF